MTVFIVAEPKTQKGALLPTMSPIKLVKGGGKTTCSAQPHSEGKAVKTYEERAGNFRLVALHGLLNQEPLKSFCDVSLQSVFFFFF